MGLDWHCIGDPETEESVCQLVKAPKGKDIPEKFIPMTTEEYHKYLERVEQEKKKPDGRNEAFIDYWSNLTLEQYISENENKYVCQFCPRMTELSGADQTESYFLGITCSSCDLRGKGVAWAIRDIGREGWEELQSECYEEHDPEDMLVFADRLEEYLNEAREAGVLDMPPYDEYLAKANAQWEETVAERYREYIKSCNQKGEQPTSRSEWLDKEEGFISTFLCDKPMTEKEYVMTKDNREEWILKAIRWLRVTAKAGCHMGTSF